jgi:hypothetical protein
MNAKNHDLYAPRNDKPPRSAKTAKNLGPEAKTPMAMIDRKGAESGVKPAPIRHKTTCFASPPNGRARRETLAFSENLAARRRCRRAPRAAI